MLCRVLDGIRNEASLTKFETLYAIGSQNDEDVRQARSRAYVHLYLKVMFGIAAFDDREPYVTDGTRDGGVDGYYIDTKARIIFLIQSKFRHSESKYETEGIGIEDLFSMQIKRILSGEECDLDGIRYNGKILGLQRQISDVPDLGRYSYRVIIIANLKPHREDSLKKITDGFPAEIVCHQRAYKELLFPVLSGYLFKASGVNILLDLSNKSSGTKIGYNINSHGFNCEITVVFVPTIEIAKMISQYKNSILQYNPRNYLEFKGAKVNEAIRETLLSADANDFALLNNGITIICDESGVNEQSGRKHRARLFLSNPQIINGGQTAYTLCRAYETLPPEEVEQTFSGKEVLVKVIALPMKSASGDDEGKRLSLIKRISNATNSQTVVTLADRISDDPVHIKLQLDMFEKYGLLYEKKSGEFSDGLRNGYLVPSDVIDRALFAKIYLASKGKISMSLRSKIAARPLDIFSKKTGDELDGFIISLNAFRILVAGKTMTKRRYTEILPKVFASCVVALNIREDDPLRQAQRAVNAVARHWSSFLQFAAAEKAKYVRVIMDQQTNQPRVELKESRGSFTDFRDNAIKFFENIQH